MANLKKDEQYIIHIFREDEMFEIIKCFHTSFTGNHLNIFRTISTIKQFYNFNNIISKVQKFVKKCVICKKNKIKKKPLPRNDLRYKLNSQIGYSNTSEFNEKLRKINEKNLN